MERKLKIRLDITPPSNIDENPEYERHDISSYEETVSIVNEKLKTDLTDLMLEKTKNTKGYVEVVHPLDIKDKIPKYEFYKMIEKNYRRIHYFEIEIFTDHKDNPPIEIPLYMPSHGLILSALRAKLSSYYSDIEFISVFDHRTKQRHISTTGLDLKYKGTRFGGSKYRLYLDNVLLIERFFPYDLLDSEQLEENVFVDVTGNYHEIKVESETANIVYITDIAVDDTVYSNINDTKYSFDFQ